MEASPCRVTGHIAPQAPIPVDVVGLTFHPFLPLAPHFCQTDGRFSMPLPSAAPPLCPAQLPSSLFLTHPKNLLSLGKQPTPLLQTAFLWPPPYLLSRRFLLLPSPALSLTLVKQFASREASGVTASTYDLRDPGPIPFYKGRIFFCLFACFVSAFQSPPLQFFVSTAAAGIRDKLNTFWPKVGSQMVQGNSVNWA